MIYLIVFAGIIMFGVILILKVFNSAMNDRRCGYCQEKVNTKATICPHCHTKFVGNDKLL